MPFGRNDNIDGVTVAICTYNGADRLPRTLAYVAAQVHHEIPFEVIVIDNASTDGTSEIVRSSWPAALAGHLRIIREERPGVAYARVRALREARYTILSFVDDDNWISPNWLTEVHRIFATHPNVAMLHCPSVANLPGSEPEDFPIYAGWLAVGQMVEQEGVVARRPVSYWTAGLSLRLAALGFLDDPEFELLLIGRTGGLSLAGEDHELCLCILLGGWDAFFTRSISFIHDIPERRLTPAYIRTLVENAGMAKRILDRYRFEIDPSYHRGYFALMSYMWEFVCRSAIYYIKRAVGRADKARIVPSAISFHVARGKVRGWFLTAEKCTKIAKNIEIARNCRMSDPVPVKK